MLLERRLCITRALRIAILSFLLPLIVSCGNAVDPNLDYQGERTSLTEYLNSRLNIMTWDEAIMTWGQPGSTFEGDEVFLATWGGEKSGGVIFPINKTIFIAPIESGWQLRLAFNKKTRTLASWQYNKW
jgi:hypothetical protein